MHFHRRLSSYISIITLSFFLSSNIAFALPAYQRTHNQTLHTGKVINNFSNIERSTEIRIIKDILQKIAIYLKNSSTPEQVDQELQKILPPLKQNNKKSYFIKTYKVKISHSNNIYLVYNDKYNNVLIYQVLLFNKKTQSYSVIKNEVECLTDKKEIDHFFIYVELVNSKEEGVEMFWSRGINRARVISL